MAPELSVIIPAFNAAATLGDQLDALGAQTADFAYEVVVCDNGSTDATTGVVRARQHRMPMLRLVDARAQRGPSYARNTGAATASGRFLAFCDADDVVAPGWLTAMRQALDAADLAVGRVDHQRLNPGQHWDSGWNEPTFRNYVVPWLPAGGSGNMAVRSDVFDALGGFDTSLATAEDLDLCWRAQLAGYRLTGVRDALVYVRRRGSLWGALRQAYRRGAGDRRLAHKYELVVQAYQQSESGADPAHSADGAAAAAVPGRDVAAAERLPDRIHAGLRRWRRAPRKVARTVRNPVLLTPYLAPRVLRLGYRNAAAPTGPQVPVPPSLPHPQ